jgi:uncharacterized integral membrane protein
MVAERIQFSPLPHSRYQTLTVLFAQEAEVEDFVARLASFSIESHAVTIIGVALGEPPKRMTGPLSTEPLKTSRYTTKGILLGGLVALVLGLILYGTNFLRLSFLEALFIHTLALVILGGVIGGAIGAILASVQAQNIVTTLPPQNTEGFLVTIKMPPHLIPQGEALARELGAKKVIS